MKMLGVVLVVRQGWDLGHSGVATFIREIMSVWGAAGKCQLVGLPGGPPPSGVKEDKKNRHQQCTVETATTTQERLTTTGRVLAGVKLLGGYLKLLLEDVVAVWRVRKELRGRIIITNDFGCETLPLALRLVFPAGTIVAMSHTHPGQDPAAEHLVRRCVEKLCAWAPSKVVFNSFASQRMWTDRLNRTLHSEVVHLGISEPDLRLPDDYPVKRDDCVDFVCVARFVAWKGHQQLVEAWRAALLQGLKHSRLILVGDGNMWPQIKTYLSKHGLESSVLMLGAKKDGPRYFNGADVAVQLSVEPEAFGLVALEAMSRHKSVLASDLGGLGEIIKDGVTGVLVDPRLLTSVAKMILDLANNRELRTQLGREGHHHWRANYTNTIMAANLEKYLQRQL